MWHMTRALRLVGPRATSHNRGGGRSQNESSKRSFDPRLLSFYVPSRLDPIYSISLRVSAPVPRPCGFASASHPAAPGPGARSEHRATGPAAVLWSTTIAPDFSLESHLCRSYYDLM